MWLREEDKIGLEELQKEVMAEANQGRVSASYHLRSAGTRRDENCQKSVYCGYAHYMKSGLFLPLYGKGKNIEREPAV